MNRRHWCQMNIRFTSWENAEHAVIDNLGPLLFDDEAEMSGTTWWFVRKNPCWRLRYRCADGDDPADTALRERLNALENEHIIMSAVPVVYEPEQVAFGGTEAMELAHQHFHKDSLHTLRYLAAIRRTSDRDLRREMSLILSDTMHRAAGLDWYECGDVWARVARHRRPVPDLPPEQEQSLRTSVHRILVADGLRPMPAIGSAEFIASWAETYTATGKALATLANTGQLHRGLRSVLAHHAIFAWNRVGIRFGVQAALASAIQTAVFGPDPAARRVKT